jgi:hypothetical protein
MQKLQIKEEIMAVAALLALGMLVMMPGLIAGSALTVSAKQVPNVGTQISAAYCGYTSYTGGNSFWGCMRDIWIPTGTILGTSAGIGTAYVKAGETLGSWRLIMTGLRFLRFSGWGFVAAVA